MKIKDLFTRRSLDEGGPKSDRPREKLIAKGAENLKDSELLAILLGAINTPAEWRVYAFYTF